MDNPINALVLATVENQASDLFMAEGELGRIKINGQLWTVGERPLTRAEMEDFWLLCGGSVEKDWEHDGSYHVEGVGRFRVNLHRQRGRLAAILRLIKTEIPTLEFLGAPERLLTRWMSVDSGLVIISGATGSGKSTTLAACLGWINEHFARHIVTIEDPIEYLFENDKAYFTQRAVGIDTESFAEGLRASLRQAPDVIFVGEIRDATTARVALRAAETGHLVLSTVHSSGVVDAVERLSNFFTSEERGPALQMLSHQLMGVVCQKLLVGIEKEQLLVCEHFENVGATRNWIRETDLSAISSFISRKDDPNNVSFLTALVAQCERGQLALDVAERASVNGSEFRRSVRGVS